jgi:hypothetical protein
MRFSYYSDTSANEQNSSRNHIRWPKSSLAETLFHFSLSRKLNNPVGLLGLHCVMCSAHFFVTQIQTDKISSWNGRTVHVCCFMLARACTKTFLSVVPGVPVGLVACCCRESYVARRTTGSTDRNVLINTLTVYNRKNSL